MTEQPTEKADQLQDLQTAIDDVNKKTEELQAALTVMEDELEGALDDVKATITQTTAEILAFCKNILEKNQQLIWNEGIGEVLKEVRETNTMLQKATNGET